MQRRITDIELLTTAIIERTSKLYGVKAGQDEFFCPRLQAQLCFQLKNIKYSLDAREQAIIFQDELFHARLCVRVNSKAIEKAIKTIHKCTKGRGETYVNAQDFINKAARAARSVIDLDAENINSHINYLPTGSRRSRYERERRTDARKKATERWKNRN